LPAGERHHQFDGEFGGLWRANGAPPHALVGIGFVAEGFDIGSYYVRTRQSLDPRAKFIFQGVGEDERIGDFGMLGGAAGLELDATDPAQGTPAHALVLAKSVGHSNVYVVTPETMISTHLYVDAISNALARAEMTFFETPSGGAVFSTGSIAWAASLGYNAFRNNVARISENVVQRFLDSAAFTLDRPAG
jgi:N,N-dimethylformamidase